MAFALFAGACSQSDPHPSTLTNCQGSATSCGSSAGPQSSSGSSGGPSGGGATDASDATGGAACGALASPDTACEACLEQSCCTEAIVCSNNADCLGLSDCLASCQPSNQPCITGCQGMHGPGQASYNAFISCLQMSCGASCQVSGAGTDCGQLVFSTTCDPCITRSCCAAAAVCSNDPNCMLLSQCLQTCAPGNTVCTTDCQTTAPGGAGVYASLGQCISTNCSGVCP